MSPSDIAPEARMPHPANIRYCFMTFLVIVGLNFSAHQVFAQEWQQHQFTQSAMTDGRVIARFDFEEAERAPLSFPAQFTRLIAPDRDLLPFGEMKLDNAVSSEGRWSFAFALERGSLAAHIPTGILPILPYADYDIQLDIRTDGLTHAAARVTAFFHDAAGNPIPGSRQSSPPIRTQTRWEHIRLKMPGHFPGATDLVILLELQQPQSSKEDELDWPDRQDIGGRAWFDNIVVRHLPRLELRMNESVPVYLQPEIPTLLVTVRDMTEQPLSAFITVRNDRNQEVLRQPLGPSFPLDAIAIPIPVQPAGWYEAQLLAEGPEGLLGLARQSFIILPPKLDDQSLNPAIRFGFVIDDDHPDLLAIWPTIAQRTGARAASVEVWKDPALTGPAYWPSLQRTIERLLDTGLELTLRLDEAPREVALRTQTSPGNVARILAYNQTAWKPALEDALLAFGIRVTRWQSGTRWADVLDDWDERESILARARQHLTSLIPGGTVIVPVEVHDPILNPESVPDIAITLPYGIQPQNLEAAIEPWLEYRHSVDQIIQPIPAETYTPRQRALDLLLRGLHAWRSNPRHLLIPQPWAYEDQQLQIDVTANMLRTLADRLHGREFAGELNFDPFINAWILDGGDERPAAMVLWAEGASPQNPKSFTLVLAAGPVTMIDAFGNRTTIEPTLGVHHLTLSETPVFIEGIDINIARFRQNITLDPHTLPAAHQAVPGTITLANPWPEDREFKLTIAGDQYTSISPAAPRMFLRAGESTEIPIQLNTRRETPTGQSQLTITAEVRGEPAYRLTVHPPLLFDWPDVNLAGHWRIAYREDGTAPDLIIIAHITNQADRPQSLEVNLRGPNIPQNRRLISQLPPGTTVARTFVIPNGVEFLANRKLWVSASEIRGTQQDNIHIEIPDLRDLINPADASNEAIASQPLTTGAEAN